MPSTNQVSDKVLNDIFWQRAENESGREKIAGYGGSYIRDRLREVAFVNKVVPPENVQRSECQRSEHHDTLVRIIDVEPNSKALSLTFRGQPRARMISGKRFAISFQTISSEKFEKTEQELLAYEMPITRIIEENTVKDMQAIKDRIFLINVDACVQALQYEANSNAYVEFAASKVRSGAAVEFSVIKGEGALNSSTDDYKVHPVMKSDFIRLKQAMHNRHRRAVQLLITEPDFDGLSLWTIQDMWSGVKETSEKGWSSDTVAGLKIIRTIKTEVLRPGNMYIFTDPEFFGRNYVLNNVKFYIDKIANVISWQSWEDVGMGFVGVHSVVKLELYAGSVVDGHTTSSLYVNCVPKSEEDMFPVYNRVENGTFFPSVVSF